MAAALPDLGKMTELRQRLLFLLGALVVFRIGAHIPVPGIDPNAMAQLFDQQRGTILDMFNMFSGGALGRLSLFALGVMPYISASIILQLMSMVVPALEQLRKEGGAAGRHTLTRYTRYLTVVLAAFQAIGVSIAIQGQMVGNTSVVIAPGLGFVMTATISLVTGTMFLVWLGEQVTERGIGNGISLIITAGIVAALPDALFQTFTYLQKGVMKPFTVLVILVLAVAVIAVIVFFERGQRRIPVQYARRVVGRKMYGGQSTHLPLKVNTSGVIPPIFASSILLFPATLANFIDKPWMQDIQAALQPDSWTYTVLYVVLIVFFCYFYTAVTFNPIDVADNMKKYGGYIPGIRPGKQTAVYIDKVLSRITFGGALYISAVCVLPTLMIAQFNVPFYFGGTSLLIVVGVSLDTVSQIETHLITRHYDGLTGPKGPRIRGRSSRG